VRKMAKYVNAGELRTPIKFVIVTRTTDSDGYPTETETAILATKCKWVNVHGTEVFTAMQQQLKEPATITVRYSALINQRLLVYKGTDPEPYQVISIDDVEDRHRWLEIKVQRSEGAV
jgi:SPP1 family predicted phage head-tail adaptor